MRAGVSQLVLDELAIRAECLEEECPNDAASIRAGIANIKTGAALEPGQLQAIRDEMGCMESFDVFTESWRDWYAAAAFFGMLEEYSPAKQFLGRKPGKITIDGRVYESWRTKNK